MPLRNQPLVFIVLLNYKTAAVTQRCLRSLERLTYSNYRILVLDNDSEDGSFHDLAKQFSNLTVIQTGANWGYAGGNNLGIEYAAAQGAEFILILNPDTTLANPVFLDELVHYLQQHPRVGIAGPKVFFQNTGTVQNTVLFPPGFWRNAVNWFAYRIAPDRFRLSADNVVGAEVLNGVCLLLRTACLQQIGLFDENIFMYIEDADMDYRARQSGWQVQYVPIDSVIHEQKQAGYDMTGEVSFLLKRNSVYYLWKIGKRLDAVATSISFVLLLLIRGLLKRDFARHRKLSLRLAKACFNIFRHKYDSEFGLPFTRREFK